METPRRCKYGHELTPDNLAHGIGARHRPCLRCTRNASRAKQTLHITLAQYMEREAEYDAVFDASPHAQAPRLDWTLPHHCTVCRRAMRPQKSAKDSRPPYAGRGLCVPCYKREQRKAEARTLPL